MKQLSEFVGEILFKINYLKYITKLLFLNKKAFSVFCFEYIIKVVQIYLELVSIVIEFPIRKGLEHIFSYTIASFAASIFVIPFYLVALPFSLIARFVDTKKSNDFFESQEGVTKLIYDGDEQNAYIRKKYFLTTFGKSRNE